MREPNSLCVDHKRARLPTFGRRREKGKRKRAGIICRQQFGGIVLAVMLFVWAHQQASEQASKQTNKQTTKSTLETRGTGDFRLISLLKLYYVNLPFLSLPALVYPSRPLLRRRFHRLILAILSSRFTSFDSCDRRGILRLIGVGRKRMITQSKKLPNKLKSGESYLGID